MRGGTARGRIVAVVLESAAASATMFGLLRRSLWKHVRLHLCGGGSGGGLRIAKRSKGGDPVDPFIMHWAESIGPPDSSQGVRQFPRERWPRDRATKPGPGINEPAASPSEARAAGERSLTSAPISCCTPRSWPGVLRQYGTRAPKAGQPGLHSTLCSRWAGDRAPPSINSSMGTDPHSEQGRAGNLITARFDRDQGCEQVETLPPLLASGASFQRSDRPDHLCGAVSRKAGDQVRQAPSIGCGRLAGAKMRWSGLITSSGPMRAEGLAAIGLHAGAPMRRCVVVAGVRLSVSVLPSRSATKSRGLGWWGP